MREIKFRAWDLYNKRMIELGDLETISVKKDLDFANYELMQYTGLCDRNGKEVYDGDVVTWGEYGERNQVVFKNGAFRIIQHSLNDISDVLGNLNYAECEIIGNIYENPELLK